MTVVFSSMACGVLGLVGGAPASVADLSAAGRVRLDKPPEQCATSARSINLSRDFPRHCLLASVLLDTSKICQAERDGKSYAR